jgi:Fic family protein
MIKKEEMADLIHTYMEFDKSYYVNEIAEALDVTSQKVTPAMQKLLKEGIVVKIKKNGKIAYALRKEV